MEEKVKLSITEKIAMRYLTRGQGKPSTRADEWYILNTFERKAIRNTQIQLYVLSALSGVLGVLAYYLPVHYYPDFFPKNKIILVGEGWELPIVANLYSLVLGIIEVAVLTILNLNAVHQVAVACGYPDTNDPLYDRYIAALADVGLEKKDKRLLRLGLNPLQDVPKIWVILITIFNFLKAMMSNLLIKFLVSRYLGRAVMRLYLNLISAPIYAFWNVWAASRVIREARIRIMSPRLIEKMLSYLDQRFRDVPLFREHLYDILQLMATCTRRFHYTHYMYAQSLLHRFGIPEKEKHIWNGDEISLFQQLPEQIRFAYSFLIAFGFMIDGKFGYREEKMLKSLFDSGFSPFSTDKAWEWERLYREGYGMAGFFKMMESSLFPPENVS